MKVECTGYFFTPCKHAFHAICIRKWTETKLECPTCRHVLTPVSKYDGEEDLDEIYE